MCVGVCGSVCAECVCVCGVCVCVRSVCVRSVCVCKYLEFHVFKYSIYISRLCFEIMRRLVHTEHVYLKDTNVHNLLL